MQPRQTNTEDHWFIIHEDKILLLRHSSSLSVPQAADVVDLTPFLTRIYDIGQFNDRPCHCAELTSTAQLPENFELLPLRKALETLGAAWYGAATKAYSVINWDRNHQYCGHCNHITAHKPGLFERTCTNCGLAFYPRISPSVIVLIQRGEELLMARGPHFMPGVYGLIAGFVEVGESLEAAVHREVKEEVDLQIKNLRYFCSQPWPFPDSLMVGFTAEYAAGEINIDKNEIEAAGWYRYDNLPGKPSVSLSIARKLIDYFVAQQSALHKK
jgi:NAD+ diphosphatase